jgi:hypothetical protein
MKLLLPSTAFLVACISSPAKPGAMCQSTDDCASGEVCQEGTCWGNPPMGTFAAEVIPPGDRSDLVTSEIPLLAIPQNGWLGAVTLPTPVTFSGRVEAYCAPGNTTCMTTSLGATITVTRQSGFAGGPDFRDVITAKDAVARGTNSFSAPLPMTGATDSPFIVSIVPDGRADQPPTSGISPAMIAPPMHTTLTATQSASTIFVLGSAQTQTITGMLTDGTHALSKYRVVAIGQWDATSPLTEVSTVAYSSDGTFHLLVADGVYGPVEIVAKPYGTGVVAPILHLGSVLPGATQALVAQPAGLGNPLSVTMKIVGVAGNGGVAPVGGARVIVTGTYDPMLGGTRAVLSVEAITGDDGLAHLDLLDGTTFRATYKLRVIPPAGANVGVIYDQPLPLDATPGTQTLPDVRLPARIALSGTLVDSGGNALANVSVTARPSLRFMWTLDAAAQQFLAEIPAATFVTPETGDFAVWVDPFVANVWGHYDLAFEPATGATAPSWTWPDVEIPRVQNLTSQPVGTLDVPDAAFIHGQLSDPSGMPIPTGELRVFGVTTDLSLCSQVPNPPANCVIPAELLGHGTADDQGVVRLTLPRS